MKTLQSNRELSELESLIEAKIFREDDLEKEIDRLKSLNGGTKSRAESQNSISKITDISNSKNNNASNEDDDPLIREFLRDAKPKNKLNNGLDTATNKKPSSALAAASGFDTYDESENWTTNDVF